MAETSSIFPIFLRAEYREGQGFQRFQSDAQRAVAAVKREMAGIGPALDQALSRQRSSTGSLDLGTDNLRELVRQQQNGVTAARELANATRGLAEASRFQDQSLTLAAKAALEDLRSKERQLATTSEQVRLLGSVQTELNKTSSATSVLTGENLKLAQAEAAAVNGAALLEGALRGTALETGRVAKSARESAQAFDLLFAAQEAKSAKAGQDFFNTALGLNAVTKSARESAQAFELMFAAQDEAAAARGADLVQAALRGTALEAGRVTKSAQESAQAFDLLFQAQDARSTAAAQNFINTALGIDQTTKSARESARAFEELFAAQDRAAAAAQKNAASAAQLRAELDPMFVAQQRFDQELVRADALLEAGAISTREYAAAQQLARDNLQQTARAIFQTTEATKQGTTARANVINSVRAERTAFVQLGQQLQDVTIQAQLGTSAFTIFAQQVPQAAFALSGLEGNSNKTKDAIGRFATFLSGPWGAAIFAATAILGPFVAKLFQSSDASDELRQALDGAKFASDGMSSAQSILGNVIDLTTGKMKDQTAAAVTLARAQLQLAEVRARVAAQEARSALQSASQRTVQVGIASAGVGSFGGTVFRSVRRPTISADAANKALAGDADGALKILKDAVDTGKTTAAIYAETATAVANLGVETENIKRFGEALKGLEGDQKALSQFLTPKTPKSPRTRKSGGSSDSAAREAERLADFGAQAAEQIQRLNERFDEQPKLIDQAAQATRQLDSIIAELEKRKPANFKELVEDAEEAKRTIEDALVRPLRDMREQSEQRLQIEALITQGRDDEAAALQEVFNLQRQIGDLTSDQKAEIEDIVLTERARTEELQRQRAELEQQVDVVRTVASDLQDILSGRPADLIKNFRQALQDLQGARLFEDLFGDTFEQLEEELGRSTPLGKAQTKLTKNVEEAAVTVAKADTALDRMATAAEDVARRLNSVATDSSFDEAFAPYANDNGLAVGPDGVPILTVNGAKDAVSTVRIERASIGDIADRIAKGIVEPLTGSLEDLLGPQFAAALGGVLEGALAGLVRGGEVGAVLGGAKGLADALATQGGGLGKAAYGVSSTLNTALEGAGTGTAVAGIGNALGIGLSSTGAQIGGAIGKLIPIPGGEIIGAIAGGIIGKLVGAKVGTANIGGSGGSLAVTGFSGKSGSRKEAAGTLAGSVLDAVDNIASELGAQIDASRGRVSIGLYKDNYRVDTTGRGKTKNEAGVLDFGKDAEAAIRAAVRDLIQDGVIQGLSDAENRLLQAGDDLEDAIRDVLDFRAVFDRLKQIKDPLGFAIDQLNKEFEQLIDLFERAGASTEEFAQLEELYNLERARAIEEATDRVVGSLKQLLNDLTIGDSGLSLRTRRANAETEFNALAARVAAGDTTAFDDFSDISKQLLDIERQLFGSTQSYFDRLSQITALTEQAIAGQSNVTSIAQNQPSPFGDRQEINRSIDIMNADVTGWLRAINDNLIALAGNSGGGSGEVFPRAVQNF